MKNFEEEKLAMDVPRARTIQVRWIAPLMAGLGIALGASTTEASVLVPFDQTGDLFVLDNGSHSVLRIAPDGTVSVALSKAEILLATGKSSVGFRDKGIVFDRSALEAMYFTENRSRSILKYSGGTLSVLTTRAAIKAAQGGKGGDPEGLAFGDDGFLYVTDDRGDSVLKVDPNTGTVGLHTSRAAIQALPGIAISDIEAGIVAAPGGVLYVTNEDTPDAILKIASDGTPSVLTSSSVFSDLDVFMTRASNGDLIVGDDSSADTIYRVTTAGLVSTFLSETALEAVTGGDVDLEGGIALDSSGNFYVAEEASDNILRFDSSLSGSVWVSKADIKAVTGRCPNLAGGVAFAPVVPEPSTLLVWSLLGVLATAAGWCRRRGKQSSVARRRPPRLGQWPNMPGKPKKGQRNDRCPIG